MKTIIQVRVLLVALIFSAAVSVHAQMTAQPGTVENPNAVADMKVVADFTNALVAGDVAQMRSLMGDKFMAYGPAAADSSNAEQYIKGWVEGAYKTATNRKVGFVTQSFKVLQGDLAGNWVSTWGTYTFTQDGKNIVVPYQTTFRIADGKIQDSHHYYDNLSIITQLGFTVTPPKKM